MAPGKSPISDLEIRDIPGPAKRLEKALETSNLLRTSFWLIKTNRRLIFGDRAVRNLMMIFGDRARQNSEADVRRLGNIVYVFRRPRNSSASFV